MPDVVASEITRVSDEPAGQHGYDKVFLEVYVDHTFSTNDKIYAADLGAESILGILGAAAVDSAGGQDTVIGNDLGLVASNRLNRGYEVGGGSGLTDAETDDFINVEAGLNGALGLWLMLLIKVN
jgi:hypothetical protein